MTHIETHIVLSQDKGGDVQGSSRGVNCPSTGSEDVWREAVRAMMQH